MHDAPAFDSLSLADGVSLHAGADTAAARALLTPNAVSFVAKLHRKMNGRRVNLLFARTPRYAAWDRGGRPDYLAATELPEARGDWQVAPLPADLQTRRVEITGPVSDARMVINMLSRTADGHRADCAMVDFEDSMKPSWTNVVQGVHNVIEAAQGTLRAEKVDAGGQALKTYQLDPGDAALLMVRVRGLHLDESNLRIDNEPVSGALLDFALCAFHAAPLQIQRGATPKFYLPKVEHHLEARWFADLFKMAEDELGFERSTLRCTLLIETLPAAYQMEEILYQIREHAAGLNGGRWDKIFSDIKCLKNHEDRVLADRATIGMNREWMSNYAKQLIRVCHRHGAFGMGGMAAFTPGRDAARRDEQTAKVVADKEFEAGIGHDGCWVSHPYFIGPALAPFEKKLAETGASNQLSVIPDLPGSARPPAPAHRAEDDGRPPHQPPRRHRLHARLARRPGRRRLGRPDGRPRDLRDLPRPGFPVDAQRRPARLRRNRRRRARLPAFRRGARADPHRDRRRRARRLPRRRRRGRGHFPGTGDAPLSRDGLRPRGRAGRPTRLAPTRFLVQTPRWGVSARSPAPRHSGAPSRHAGAPLPSDLPAFGAAPPPSR